LEAEKVTINSEIAYSANFTAADETSRESASSGASSTRTLFTIGEISREFGFTLRALRFYEEKGLISPRRNGNRRLYSIDDRRRLEIIASAKKVGMPLDDIRDILKLETAGDHIGMLRVALEKTIARLDTLEEEKTQVESHTREALKLIEGLNKQLEDKVSTAGR
jgi:DNA-binding transcriptional MerR regulator